MVIVAVLAVPLGMMVSGNVGLFVLGCQALCVSIGGSVGYLLGGWRHALVGMAIGALVAIIPLCALISHLWMK